MRAFVTAAPPLSAFHVGGDILLRGAMFTVLDAEGYPVRTPARVIATTEAEQLAGYLSREALAASARGEADVAALLSRQAAELDQAIRAQATWVRCWARAA